MSQSFRQLISLAEDVIGVADLVGPLEVTMIDPETPASEAVAQLREWEFDAAPVDEDPVRRYVTRVLLEEASGVVGEVAEPIDASLLVPFGARLVTVIERLVEHPFLFVLGPSGVGGILTRADLQRTPVSMLVLGLVLAGESALNALIARHHAEWDWLELLSESRRGRIEEVYSERVQANAHISKLECLTFEDRLRVAERTARIYKDLGFESRSDFERATRPFKRLRNVLAHGGGLLDADQDPCVALKRFEEVRTFVERAWATASTPDPDLPGVPVPGTAT